MTEDVLRKVETLQKELDDYLLELADVDTDDTGKISKIGNGICKIYRTDVLEGVPFRHQYRFFFDVLDRIEPDKIDVLLTNLRFIIDETGSDDAVRSKLMKLYDHISLDIKRKTYYERELRNEKEITGMKEKVDQLSSRADEAYAKVERIQLEIVAVLGVFAAIVIGFTGGLDVIGGALSNVGTKDFPLVLFSVSLCGMVLFDVLLLLMTCIMRIVKDRKDALIDMRYVLAFNGVMIALMFVAFIWDSL